MNRTYSRLHAPLAGLAVAAGLFILSPAAHGQAYVVSTRTEPYTNLDNIPGIGSVTTIFTNFSSTLDRNNSIGFDFVFAGSTYTQFGVSVEGWVGMEPLGTTSSTPNNVGSNTDVSFGVVFAPFWDNLSSNTARTGLFGTAPNRVRVIEWDTWQAGSGGSSSDSGRMQVWLLESGSVEFRYSGTITTGYSATMGVTGPAGSPHLALLPCGETANCTSADFTSAIGTVYSVEIALTPELTGSFGVFPRGLLPGVSGTGEIVLENLGVATATSVAADIWLSVDQTLDTGDTMLGSVLSDVPNGTTSVTANINVPSSIPAGDYFLLLDVDPADTWSEPNENNNVILSPNMFATAYELEPSELAVTNAGGVNPGSTINFDLTIRNNGALRAGPLEVTFYVSSDVVLSIGQDPVVGTTTVNLAGGSNVEVATASGTLPPLTPGTYYAIAVIDPNDLLIESNELNNSVVSADTFQSGADFAIGSIVIPAQAQPGSPITITTTIDSPSVPFTGSVEYRLWASTDQMLDPSNDTPLNTFSWP